MPVPMVEPRPIAVSELARQHALQRRCAVQLGDDGFDGADGEQAAQEGHGTSESGAVGG